MIIRTFPWWTHLWSADECYKHQKNKFILLHSNHGTHAWCNPTSFIIRPADPSLRHESYTFRNMHTQFHSDSNEIRWVCWYRYEYMRVDIFVWAIEPVTQNRNVFPHRTNVASSRFPHVRFLCRRRLPWPIWVDDGDDDDDTRTFAVSRSWRRARAACACVWSAYSRAKKKWKHGTATAAAPAPVPNVITCICVYMFYFLEFR